MHQSRWITLALDHPWAVTEPMLAIVATIVARHVAGAFDVEAAAARFSRPVDPAEGRNPPINGVQVIPLHGTIAPRLNMMANFSGGTSFDEATRQVREAVASKDVSSIVLDWDSPGGSTAGATEFAAELRRAREIKPVISHANFQMCSAAYWTGSNASEIVASPSSVLGSIGVYSIHEDISKSLDELGVKITAISAGKHKLDGAKWEPLSEAGRARIKSLIDATYGRFVNDVALGRKVPEATVRAGYGEGAIVNADEALAMGMIDRIETLDGTLARLTAAPPTPVPVPLAAGAIPAHLAAHLQFEHALHALEF